MSHRAATPSIRPFPLIDEYAAGFQLLHAIQLGDAPSDRERLIAEVSALIENARRQGLAAGLDPSAVEDAGYAFCAALDEAVLASECNFRAQWESQPMQVALFGDQLAGEHFFDRLERQLERGPGQLPTIEVFHMCLVLGFRGRYHLEGGEKIRHLKARLAAEIATGRGQIGTHSPHWARPDNTQVGLRHLVSLVAIFVLVLCGAAVAWNLLDRSLRRQTVTATSGHEALVRLPAQVAHLSIKLP